MFIDIPSFYSSKCRYFHFVSPKYNQREIERDKERDREGENIHPNKSWGGGDAGYFVSPQI